jgi:hypothetical protein
MLKKTLMKSVSVSVSALLITVVFASSASAATIVVTPADEQGWSTADTRPGGDVNFVTDATSPLPTGALQLTTDATNEAKAQYLKAVNTPLSSVTDLSYSTKQVSGPVHADPSYQLLVDLNGTTTPGGFTTLVYEPYQQATPIIPGAWQTWDVDAGQFWSSRSFSEGTCTTVAGAGGAPFYTLAGLQATCPNAEVVGFGVNIGTFNPGYDVYTDAVSFDATTYNFELVPPPPTTPSNKDQCKNDGWMTFTAGYKNQGQCVSAVTSNR